MHDEVRLKRLKYRSGHRGCKETDLVLGQFANERMAALDADALDLYEALLDENDVDIWNWLTGADTPPDSRYDALLEILLSCHSCESRNLIVATKES